MLHFFPYLREQISSGKSREDIYMILYSALEQRKLFLSLDVECAGEVYPAHFKIRLRKKYYRNSFVPVITGTVTEKEEGCVIDAVMQIDIAVRIGMLVWFGFLLVVFSALFISCFISGFDNMRFLAVPFFMMVCGQIMMRCCFYGPARKALEELREWIC